MNKKFLTSRSLPIVCRSVVLAVLVGSGFFPRFSIKGSYFFFNVRRFA